MSSADQQAVTFDPEAQFPPVDREAWKALAEAVVAKGLKDPTPAEIEARFRSQLVTVTADGLEIEPLYDQRSVKELGDPGLPGQAPYLRGRTPAAGAAGGWDVCQRVELTAPVERQVLDELEGGAGSVWLCGPDAAADRLPGLLKDVLLDLVTIRLGPPGPGSALPERLLGVWEASSVAPEDLHGSLGIDPLGWMARSGTESMTTDDIFAEVRAWTTRLADSYPGARAVVADGTVYNDGGASDAQELAFALATGVDYLRHLVAHGFSTQAALGSVEVRHAIGPEQFSGIAKLRAARQLWSRVVEALGQGSAPPPIHAVTSRAMLSVYDPWVNLLRTTLGAFAGVIGGADALTVLPHDLVSSGGASSQLGRRMARNVQALLGEESHLARIVDMAGGSWYVESLTEQLAERAWEIFQAIEARGGMQQALVSSWVAEQVGATRAWRQERVANGRAPLTGVSEFPDAGEAAPPPEVIASLIEPDPATAAGGPSAASGLGLSRYGAELERLRARVDAARAQGQETQVFLATLGPLAAHTARATWAQNLFAIAGIRAIRPEPEAEPGTWGQMIRSAGVKLACICGDDKTYQSSALEAAGVLGESPVERIYLAGKGGDLRSELEEAGVSEFAYQGVDRMALLSRALDVAGVR